MSHWSLRWRRQTLACATLAAAALCLGWHAPAQSPYLDIVISEIMYHAPGDDAAGEFIELTNRGSASVSLEGWSLEDGVRYIFPSGVTLAPGARLVVAGNRLAVQQRYGLAVVYGNWVGRLENGGERIALLDRQQGLVNEVWYDDKSPWPEGGDGDGRSIELVDLWRNGNAGQFWRPSSALLGSPGAPNQPGGERPYPVVINEFLADSSAEDWIELYNLGPTAVDLAGFYLTDDPVQPMRKMILASWAGDTVLQPGGFFVAQQSDLGFGLSADGEQLYLVAPDGRTWVDGYDFGPQPAEDVSEGRFPDGNERWIRMPATSPGAPNTYAPAANVVINEINYHPAAGDPGPEYVELYNPGPTAVSLTKWTLANGVDYAFPGGTSIPPDGFLVIAADPQLVMNTYGITGVLGPYSGVLSNWSEQIELRDSLGNAIDEVEYRDEGLWPEEADGLGSSLELRSHAVDNRLPAFWAASVGPGTPGASNSGAVADPGASVDQLRHWPLVPTSTQAVTVTALADATVLSAVRLYWKRDQDTAWKTVVMKDDGTGGDRLAGDGFFAGQVPPQANGTIVEFYVGAASTGGSAFVPRGAPDRSALYIVENAAPDTNLVVYRFVMTDENHNWLHTRDAWDETRVDCTFIHGDRAYYNCGIRFRSGNRGGPKYSYKVYLPDGYRFRDADRFNLNYEKNDRTLLKNKIATNLLQRLGLPGTRTEYVHTRWRGSYAGVHLYAESHGRDYLSNHFPGDDTGDLYKAGTCCCAALNWAEPRGWFEKETGDPWDWSEFEVLRDALSRHCGSEGCEKPCGALPADYEQRLFPLIDLENWGTSFAMWCVTLHIDTPWHFHGQNYRIYRRASDNRWVFLLYDWDDTFWGTALEWTLHASSFEHIDQLMRYPPFARVYQHAVWRCVNQQNGLFREARLLPELRYYHDMIYQDAAADPFVTSADRWSGDPSQPWFTNGVEWIHDIAMSTHNPALRGALPTASLAITTNNGQDFSAPGPTVELEGTAPISAKVIWVGNAAGEIRWLSASRWRVTVSIPYITNPVDVIAYADDGTVLATVGITITNPNGTEPGGPTATPTDTATPSPTATQTPTVTPVPAGVNLLVNPGAETGDFTGWTRGGYPDNKPSIDPGTHPILPENHSGAHRFGGSHMHTADAYMYQTVPVQPGRRYTASAWISKWDGTDERFEITWMDGPFGAPEERLYYLGETVRVEQWTLLEGAIFAPTQTQATLVVRLRHDVAYATIATFHLDDLYLGAVDPPATDTPSPVPSDTPKPTDTPTAGPGDAGTLTLF